MSEKNPHLTPQSRNAWGLIQGIDYKTNEDGSINWRAMVKPEHLFPNRGWFESRKQQMPTSIEGLADNQLLIKLSGIKELAKLRGYTSVKYDVIKCEASYVAIKCGITWISNYESEYESFYEDIANATVNNTSDFAVKFLETIAANRAFVRSVRNFLNIHIVGSDEIDASKKGTPSVFEDDNEVALPSYKECWKRQLRILELTISKSSKITFETLGSSVFIKMPKLKFGLIILTFPQKKPEF